MKRLIFVIQLMIVCNGLAMADPVISLKTLLHEMTQTARAGALAQKYLYV